MPHGSGFFFGRGIYCRSFMVTLDYRNARLALIGTWLAYVLFAALTDWTDFGLTATKDEYTRHFAVRVATVSFWLLIATVLLQLRRRFVNPGGAVTGAATAFLAAIFSASILVVEGANLLVATVSFSFYSLIAGLVCMTIRNRILAVFSGLVLYILQLSLDAIAHFATGMFALH